MFKFFDKVISGPFTIPSGIVATKVSVIDKLIREIPEIGIITTKSIGLKARQGNKEPIIARYGAFSFVNAIGLTNPGAEAFAKELSTIKIPDDKFLLISIFGNKEKEVMEIANTLRHYADGFELNVSCPHAEGYGQAVGQDKYLVERLSRAVSYFGKPVLVKVSPSLNVKETVEYAIRGGALGVTAINTQGPVGALQDGYPVLSNKVGGISGKAILEKGIECVKEIRSFTNLPIISCGGITTVSDVRRYREAGADFFGIGSALAGMNTKEIKGYFHQLFSDLENNTNNAKDFLKDELRMDYIKYKIKENKQLSEDLFLLRLDGKIDVKPGQFVFAWLPEKGEKPFSVLDDAPFSLLIKIRGIFTKELSKLKKDDIIYVRGPYGNSPEIKGKTLVVGGGTGLAALCLFGKRNKGTIALFGAKDKACLPELKKTGKFFDKIYFVTEKGDIGFKGNVTDLLERVITENLPEYCINCGPRGMVEEAIEIENQYLRRENIYSSIDFMTRCGIGLCGSCATSRGHRSCVDGTFLHH